MQSNPDLDVLPRVREDLSFRSVGQTTFAMAPDGRFLILNEASVRILRACQKRSSVGQLAADLAKEHSDQESDIRKRIEETVDQFRMGGFVVLREGQPIAEAELPKQPSAASSRNVSKEARSMSSRSGVMHVELTLLDRRIRLSCEHRTFLEAILSCYDVGGDVTTSVVENDVDLWLHLRPDTNSTGPGYSFFVLFDGTSAFLRQGLLRARRPALMCHTFNQWTATTTQRFAVLHAGALARGDRAILLPGLSGSGKSTLTAYLVRCGYGLLSDELVALDLNSGCVAPFPRKMALRHDVLSLLGLEDVAAEDRDPDDDARFVAPSELRGHWHGSVSRPRTIVFPTYQPDTESTIAQLSNEAAARRIAECYCSLHLRQPGLDRVLETVRAAQAYELRFRDLEAASKLVERLLA